MVNIRLFSIVHGKRFPLNQKNVILYMQIQLNFVMNNWGMLLVIASTESYTKTVINNQGSYSVSSFKHAVKSYVPAPQLAID